MTTLALIGVLLAAQVVNIVREPRYSRGDTNYRPLSMIDGACWLRGKGEVVRYRADFEANASHPLEIDVSGDECFVLLLDGNPIAQGPHRGTIDNWLYQSYRLKLPSGIHRLEAVVTAWGTNAPIATLSNGGGFILAAAGEYDAQLTTGKGKWLAGTITGTVSTGLCKNEELFGAGSEFTVTATDYLHEQPKHWETPAIVRAAITDSRDHWGVSAKGWALYPSPLPDMLERAIKPSNLPRPQTFAPNTTNEIIFDLGEYYCFRPRLAFAGGKGAQVQLDWVESLRATTENSYLGSDKGNRNEYKGKAFWGAFGDKFISDGRQDAHFTTPWWRPGRWGRLIVKTADEPLTLKAMEIVETHYPLTVVGNFASDDPSLTEIAKICRRGVEECGHDIAVDCPRYEQQMYPGDALMYFTAMRALSNDDRLLKRAVDIFDFARRSDGTLPMNWPTKNCQNSTTWTLCWVLMVRDQMLWHNDQPWLKSKLPGLRHTLSGLAMYENSEGLLENAPGWSFLDWVPSWGYDKTMTGTPPDAGTGSGQGCCMVVNGLYLMAIQAAAEIETAVGARQLAEMWREKAAQMKGALRSRFLDQPRGLFADTIRRDSFSVHSQALALLSGLFTDDERDAAIGQLLDDEQLTQCAPYFLHYLFTIAFTAGRTDYFEHKLDIWREYVKLGLKCPLESPTFPRSDCHGFGAFPIYHYLTGLAGVKPAAPFFGKVAITPQPGKLKWITATVPHPQGAIRVELRFASYQSVEGEIVTPVEGYFNWRGESQELKIGKNRISLTR